MGAVSTDTLSRPVQIPCPLHEQCSRFRLGWPVVPPKNLREITTPDWVGSKVLVQNLDLRAVRVVVSNPAKLERREH